MNVTLDIGVGGGDLLKNLKDTRAALAEIKDTNQELNQSFKDMGDISVKVGTNLSKTLIDANADLENQKKLVADIKKGLSDLDGTNKKVFNPDAIAKYNSHIKEANDLLSKLTGDKKLMNNADLTKLADDLNKTKNEFQALGVILDLTKKKLQSMDPNSAGFKDLNNSVKAAETVLKTFNTTADQAGTKQESLRQQLRQMTQQLALMKEQGQENTDQYIKLRQEAGELSETLTRARQEIKQSGSETKGFDQIIRTAKLATAGFELTQGAAALFGEENKNVAQALLKVNGAMAILNGLQEIQEELTKKDSLARSAAIAVQNLWNGSILSGSVALRVFKIALLATGIGAFIVLLGFAAEAMRVFGDKTEEETEKLKKHNEELQKNKELLGNVADQTEKARDAREGGLNQLKRELAVEDARGTNQKKIADLRQQIADKEVQNLKIQEVTFEGYADKQLDLQEQIKDKENEKVVAQVAASKKLADQRKQDAEKQKALDAQITEFLKQEVANRSQTVKDGNERDRAELIAAFENEETTLDAAYKKIITTQKLSADKRAKVEASYQTQKLDIAAKYSVKAEDLEKKHQDEMAQIAAAANEGLAAITGNEKAKEIASLDQKYLEITDHIRKGGKLTADVEKQIAAARNKDAADIDLKYKNQQLDNLEAIEVAKVELLSSNKFSPALLEEIKQQKVLEVQLKYAKLKLEALQAAGGKENEVLIAQAQATVSKLQTQLKAAQLKNNPISEALGVTDDQLKDMLSNSEKSFDSLVNIFENALKTKIDLNQKELDSLNSRIDTEQTELDRELDLQKKGYANNVTAKQAELGSLKAQRDKDLEQQKKLQQEMAKLEVMKQEAALATSSAQLILTAANIIENFSELGPLGVLAGVAEAFAVLEQFSSIKQQVRANQSLGEGGEVGGEAHTSGGNKYVSMDGNDPRIVEIEDGEYLTNKRSTSKYKPVLEAINKDEIGNWTIDEVLKWVSPSDISVNNAVAKKVIATQSEVQSREITIINASTDAAATDYLKSIASSNKEMLNIEQNRPEIEDLPDKTIVKRGNKIRIYKK